MLSKLTKYQLILLFTFVVFALVSCQKGGEPTPFNSGIESDEVTYQNKDIVDDDGTDGGVNPIDDGDDNEDEDDIEDKQGH